MSESNVEIARRGYAAVARGDLDAIRDFLDPNVQWHGGDRNAPGACHSRDEALSFIQAARERRGIGQLVDIVDAGDKVIVILQPPRADGREPELRANLTTFRDGKVVEMVAYASPDEALAAVAACRLTERGRRSSRRSRRSTLGAYYSCLSSVCRYNSWQGGLMATAFASEAAHIAETGHLAVPDISRATGAHETTVRAWLRDDRSPSGDYAERLAELSALVERLVRVMQPAYIPVWMRKPIPLLDDDKPLDVIAQGDYRRVSRVVASLESPGAA